MIYAPADGYPNLESTSGAETVSGAPSNRDIGRGIWERGKLPVFGAVENKSHGQVWNVPEGTEQKMERSGLYPIRYFYL
ncbi:hypothetical protein Holit_02586 [Hollandina sp. SP2]